MRAYKLGMARVIAIRGLATKFEASLHQNWLYHNELWKHPSRVQMHSTYVYVRARIGAYLCEYALTDRRDA
jgi:hypothetical protein